MSQSRKVQKEAGRFLVVGGNQSSSATTGDLVVTGGIGCGGTITLTGNVSASVITSSGATNADSLDITGNTTTYGITIDGKTTVQQATSITTGVTINRPAGVISTVSATTASNTISTFTVTNAAVGASSIVLANIIDYTGNPGAHGMPGINVNNIASGSFDIHLKNPTGAPLAGNVTIGFLVV